MIAAWRADHVVSLVEWREFAALGVARPERLAEAPGHLWSHFPLPDMNTPDALGAARWRALVEVLMADLARGSRVLLHCAAGLGRTGTVAAGLLINLGWSAPAAIAKLRETRPGTIESDAQQRFLNDPARVRVRTSCHG